LGSTWPLLNRPAWRSVATAMDRPAQLKTLGNPRAYRAQVERLLAQYRRGARLEQVVHRGVTLSSVAAERTALARRLAKVVGRGRYRFEPLTQTEAHIEGKLRTLYRSCLTDLVVLAVLGRVFTELCRPWLSPRVYSYLPGRSSWQAVADLAAFLRAHRRQYADPRDRGLYVIQRDVRRYGESIPTASDSPLWPLLDEALAQADTPRDHCVRALLRAAVRPTIRQLDGELAELAVGVPTGSPIQPAVCNLYLTPVDRALHNIPGGFYARFGDDLLFAHPDPNVTERAARTVVRECDRLGLQLKPAKHQDTYFSGPGRLSALRPELRRSSHIEYLGCRIAFDGCVGLKREKARRLLERLRGRLRRSAGLLRSAPTDERAEALCAVASRALDPRAPLAEPAAALLQHVVDDRRQLKQLDYLVALTLAETLAGTRGVRAFRDVPYRDLRQRFGLRSLVVARNRASRGKGGA
jgi:hypothetical protein